MKEYKVEPLIFHSKITFDTTYIVKESKEAIQEKLDEYAAQGYILTSTNATNFESDLYVYLYFEKIV